MFGAVSTFANGGIVIGDSGGIVIGDSGGIVIGDATGTDNPQPCTDNSDEGILNQIIGTILVTISGDPSTETCGIVIGD
jgi:hypothetical protein